MIPTAPTLPRVYKLRTTVALFYVAIAVVPVLLVPKIWFVSAAVAAPLLWAVVSLRRGRVVISEDSIEFHSRGRIQRRRVDELRGYRKTEGRSAAWFFEPKDPADGVLHIADVFAFDTDFHAWLTQLPDLDRQEREAAAREEEAAFKERQEEFDRRDAEWRRQAAARKPD